MTSLLENRPTLYHHEIGVDLVMVVSKPTLCRGKEAILLKWEDFGAPMPLLLQPSVELDLSKKDFQLGMYGRKKYCYGEVEKSDQSVFKDWIMENHGLDYYLGLAQHIWRRVADYHPVNSPLNAVRCLERIKELRTTLVTLHLERGWMYAEIDSELVRAARKLGELTRWQAPTHNTSLLD